MNETNEENPLAGLTKTVQDGMESLPVMKDGEEPPDMLLALLNNPLQDLLAISKAEILGTATLGGVVGTLVFVHDSKPTSQGFLIANKSMTVESE